MYEIRVIYQGESFLDGRIELRALGESLTGLSKIFEALCESVGAPKDSIKIAVRRTEDGSFVVDLVLELAPTLFHALPIGSEIAEPLDFIFEVFKVGTEWAKMYDYNRKNMEMSLFHGQMPQRMLTSDSRVGDCAKTLVMGTKFWGGLKQLRFGNNSGQIWQITILYREKSIHIEYF